MNRNHLFFLLIAIALLLTAGITFVSALHTMDVSNRVATLTHSQAEKVPGISSGQPTTIQPTQDGFMNQEWLVGFALISIVALVIGWHLLQWNARRMRG